MEATIKLDQFLKLMGAVMFGCLAKYLIREAMVSVNGIVVTRRGREIHAVDR